MGWVTTLSASHGRWQESKSITRNLSGTTGADQSMLFKEVHGFCDLHGVSQTRFRMPSKAASVSSLPASWSEMMCFRTSPCLASPDAWYRALMMRCLSQSLAGPSSHASIRACSFFSSRTSCSTKTIVQAKVLADLQQSTAQMNSLHTNCSTCSAFGDIRRVATRSRPAACTAAPTLCACCPEEDPLPMGMALHPA